MKNETATVYFQNGSVVSGTVSDARAWAKRAIRNGEKVSIRILCRFFTRGGYPNGCEVRAYDYVPGRGWENGVVCG